MFDDRAWYLIARSTNSEDAGKLLAFSHFRFDMDYDDEVLYIYEIQLEGGAMRKGLGKFMMQVLEIIAFKADMRKVMLTCFKHNPAAQKFFKDVLKYELDETCPTDDVYEQFDYDILSKMNKKKLAKEAKEKLESSITASVFLLRGSHNLGLLSSLFFWSPFLHVSQVASHRLAHLIHMRTR